jgi:Flp pilus assembly protein TadD
LVFEILVKEPFVRLLGALTLLGLFLAALRLAPTEGGDTAAVNDCELGQVRSAIALERCHSLLPRDVEIMLDLGTWYESDAKWERAEAIYRRAAAVDAADAEVRLRLARVLMQRGDAAAAAREADLVLKLRPGSRDTFALAGADRSAR